MIRPGNSELPGATADGSGVNFSLFSSVAESVELCLFDATGRATTSHALPDSADGVWHGYLPGCKPGQRYGYRVHGPWAPEHGLRCNPAKLLIDPYARELAGEFSWHHAVFDYSGSHERDSLRVNTSDSAAFVPHSVVRAGLEPLASGPKIPWAETIFYELNVRGFTMRHPAMTATERGTFDGLRNKDVLTYLKSLGVSSVELMPVHAFVDEHHLAQRGLRNFWGYNSISFFALAPRYGRADAVAEFRDMVRAIHDAGLEVILDVVYNHTAEGDSRGPTLGFRGIDNLAYYSTEPGNPGSYINDTGCGNTMNADHPQVRQLVLDSLRYWHRVMGVDGFRFDLAPVLGRHNHGFSPSHPLLTAISEDLRLHSAKLIAEPWDPGPGGYQLGAFPARWAEWNDRFRDAVRCFWRGDQASAPELARRIRGSADVFEASKRKPTASVNLITSHDGFTLADLVSYERRHNEANGEQNRDGHAHNFSHNYGVEGPTADPSVTALRRQQRLNMLATLFLSQGTPLLLAGDEFGNSQQGNNNAYAQDNETGWLDWSGIEADPDFTEQVRSLISLRRTLPLVHFPHYVHGTFKSSRRSVTIHWYTAGGESIADHEWHTIRTLIIMITAVEKADTESGAAVLINGSQETVSFRLPDKRAWRLVYSSAGSIDDLTLPALSISLLRSGDS